MELPLKIHITKSILKCFAQDHVKLTEAAKIVLKTARHVLEQALNSAYLAMMAMSFYLSYLHAKKTPVYQISICY